MFKTNKKLVAAILTAALALSSASAAFAAGSPTPTDIPISGHQDVNPKKQDTTDVLVTDNGSSIVATGVKDDKTVTVGGNVKVETIGGGTTNVPVDTVGTGSLKPNKKTKTLKTTKTVTTINSNAISGSPVVKVISSISAGSRLRLQSKALADSRLTSFETKGTGNLVIGYRAYGGTAVKSLKIRSKKVSLRQGAFVGIKKGTKTKISFSGIKNASDLSVAIGAFKSNSKNMTIIFGKDMSKKEFKKVKKILKKGGFKGRITRSK